MAIFIHESNSNLTANRGSRSETLTTLLSSMGERVTSDLSGASLLVSVDHSSTLLRRADACGVPKQSRILLQTEPTVVYPRQYDSSITRRYGRVLKIGVPGHGALLWPQDLSQDANALSQGWDERGPGALVATDRQSPTDSSMYELRRELVPKLLARGWSIRGGGWSDHWYQRAAFRARLAVWTARQRRWPSIRRHFKGVLGPRFPGVQVISRPDKVSFLANHRVTLVVENSQEYLSEKIFDAFSSGAFPVFVGPQLHDFGIPKHLALEVKGSLPEVLEAVDSITESQFVSYQSALSNWLATPAARRHSRETFARQLIDLIKQQTGLG